MEKHFKVSLIASAFSFGLLWLSVALHNFISGLLGFEEPLFFSLSLILIFTIPFILVYALIGLVLSLLGGPAGSPKKRRSKK